MFHQLFSRLLMLVSVSTPFFAVAQSKAVPVEDTFRYGSVTEGTEVKANFSIKNEGSEPLVITKVISGCSCVTAPPPTEPILPSGVVTISTSFSTTGFGGKEDRTLQVLTNDPERKILPLKLEGTVNPLVSVDPHQVSLTTVSGSTKGARTEVRISLAPPLSQSSVEVASASPMLVVGNVEGTGSTRTFSLRLADTLKVGSYRERVGILLEKEKRSHTVPVFVQVLPALGAEPASLSFRAVGSSPDSAVTNLTRVVEVFNRLDIPIQLKSVESENEAIHTRVEEISAGKRYRLICTLNPRLLTGDLNTNVIITPDKEGIEPIRVRIHVARLKG